MSLISAGSISLDSTFKVHRSSIHKFLGSFRNYKYENFSGLAVILSKSAHVYQSVNRKAASFYDTRLTTLQRKEKPKRQQFCCKQPQSRLTRIYFVQILNQSILSLQYNAKNCVFAKLRKILSLQTQYWSANSKSANQRKGLSLQITNPQIALFAEEQVRKFAQMRLAELLCGRSPLLPESMIQF